MDWLRHMKVGQSIEKVNTGKLEVSLLASKNGTEIIHHTLHEGGSWGLTPQDGWNELESVFVISGCLAYTSGDRQGIVSPGDTISTEPVKDHVIFTALEDTTFLYICSNAVFHFYSEITQKFQQLAVDIEQKDGYTADHCERIRRNSLLIGQRMNLSSYQLHCLNFGSFFHDIGKIDVPDTILLKPATLTHEEFDIMKRHPEFGKKILCSTGLPHLHDASTIVEQHHERFNGSGYPNHLKGDAIEVGAAIVAVIDSFDAMTSKRPYKRAKPEAWAIDEIISGRGSLYHPDVVDAFLASVDDITKS